MKNNTEKNTENKAMEIMNKALFARKTKYILPQKGRDVREIIAELQENDISADEFIETKEKIEEHIADYDKILSKVGYEISADFKDSLYSYSEGKVSEILDELINFLKKNTTINVKYLTLNGDKIETIENKEEKEKIVIEVGTVDDYIELINNIIKSNVGLNDNDKFLLDKAFSIEDNISKYTNEINLKENLIYITTLCMKYNIKKDYSDKFTITDIYRLMVAMSDGDISLAKKTKFRSFKKSEQRYILNLLNKVVNKGNISEMYARRGEWINALYRLNPGNYKKYKNSLWAANKIRNEKIETFSGKVNKLFEEGKNIEAFDLLATRPGEFARRLNECLNKYLTRSEMEYILNLYKTVVYSVNNRVLISIVDFYKNYKKTDVRTFSIKGFNNKTYCIDNELTDIHKDFIDFIIKVSENAIAYNNSKKSFMGRVYVDEGMKNHKIPKSFRESNEQTKIYTRGSKEKFNSDKIRFFIHWTNGYSGRVDIDLSTVLLNEDLFKLDFCDYTRLTSKNNICQHSGDITDGGNRNGVGATEFIDVDLSKAKDEGVKYIMPNVYAFNRIPFNHLDCFFGYTFDLSSTDYNEVNIKINEIENKIALTTESEINLPFVIDVENNEIIYLDMNIDIRFNEVNQVSNSINSIQSTLFNEFKIDRMNMYDLINYNINSRGIFVDEITEETDIVFIVDKKDLPANIDELNNTRKEKGLSEIKVITPFDIEVFMGDLL